MFGLYYTLEDSLKEYERNKSTHISLAIQLRSLIFLLKPTIHEFKDVISTMSTENRVLTITQSEMAGIHPTPCAYHKRTERAERSVFQAFHTPIWMRPIMNTPSLFKCTAIWISTVRMGEHVLKAMRCLNTTFRRVYNFAKGNHTELDRICVCRCSQLELYRYILPHRPELVSMILVGLIINMSLGHYITQTLAQNIEAQIRAETLIMKSPSPELL